MNSSVTQDSVDELARYLVAKEVSAEELTSSSLAQIDARDDQLNAFITVDRDAALAQARAVDLARTRNEELPFLAGIPIGIKDNICTRGLLTTAGSRMLETFVPPYDATVVDVLRNNGMVIIGKTNMDEFAMGSTTESSYFGPTHNPWNLDLVPGGTSGGSAAAVAAGEVPVALGSDTGGSIRQPAAFCGVVGVKPTYGRVSRYGLIAYASSFDQIGVLATSVKDAALLCEVIAGHDPMDSTSIRLEVPRYSSEINDGVKGLTIGIPKEFIGPGLSTDITDAMSKAVKWLEEQGAYCREVSLPTLPDAIPAYYVIATAEASANLARYDGVKYGYRHTGADSMWSMMEQTRGEGFGSEVKRRILLGAFALSAGYYDAYYLKAQRVRTLIRQDYDSVYKSCQAILMPVSPIPPWRIGERVNDPLSMYLADIYTVTANLAGLPALSLPIGLDTEGIPIGLQLQAPPFAEQMLFRVARSLEEARGVLPRPPSAQSNAGGQPV